MNTLLTKYNKAKLAIIQEFYKRVYEEGLDDYYYHDLGSTIMLNDEYWSLNDIIETIENDYNPEYVYKFNTYCIDSEGDLQVSLRYFMKNYSWEGLEAFRDKYREERRLHDIRINTPEYQKQSKESFEKSFEKFRESI